MKYRKKPVVIEAIRYLQNEDNRQEVSDFVGKWLERKVQPYGLVISTLEGEMICAPGDWIIKGVKGEFYPCKPDIFEATYEKVE